MSSEPGPKRQKMDFYVRGDDNSQESTQVSGVSASKTLPSAPTASPSGDSQDITCHQLIALVSAECFDNDNVTQTPENYDIFKYECEFGDSWTQKYPVPLSMNLQRQAGDPHYDKIIVDLGLLGYKPLQVVARTRSGIVLLAQNLHFLQHFRERETVPVAIKLHIGMPRRIRTPSETDMIDELTIHRQLHHHNIVTWVSNINYRGLVGSVMEFCDTGTLEQLKTQAIFLPESVARRYFKQIHSALDYIHTQGFAHRDVCPQNVLITQNNVAKLCDFGHAVRFMTGNPLCNDDCGTLGYQAPQILEKSPFNPRHADVWSLGAVLFSTCIGRLPLGSIRSDAIENASKEIRFPDNNVLTLSREVKTLLIEMLAYSPDIRATLNRVAHSLWVTQVNSKVEIGGFFRARQPQKTKEGSLESQMKDKLKI